jgi:cell division protein FtsW
MALSRTDTSVVARWWWTVDRFLLGAALTLVVIGFVLILAASPAVAIRLGMAPLYFIQRQLAYIPPALLIMFVTSLASVEQIRRIGISGFVLFLLLSALAMLFGPDINGARRWLEIFGISLQPSEFVKPCYAVLIAWLLTEQKRNPRFPGNLIAVGATLALLVVLFLQPNIGLSVIIIAVGLAEFFIAGLSMPLVGAGLAFGIAGLGVAYMVLPHVAARIDHFLDPSGAGNYQIDRALQAFQAGGLFGRGPGEGVVKTTLPDAHTDFIFAVAGEEFGFIVCLIIVLLFAFVVLRGLSRVFSEKNLFVMLAGSGILVQFGLQAIVNISVNLRLLPDKGETLPFISYGGSALLAMAFGMGIVLALTRLHPTLEGRL